MAIFEKKIDLNTKMRVIVIKTIAGLVFEIDNNNRDIKIDLIEVLL